MAKATHSRKGRPVGRYAPTFQVSKAWQQIMNEVEAKAGSRRHKRAVMRSISHLSHAEPKGLDYLCSLEDLSGVANEIARVHSPKAAALDLQVLATLIGRRAAAVRRRARAALAEVANQ